MKINLKTIYKEIFNESFRIKITNFKRKLKGWMLRGNAVKCNCCGKTFRKFLSKGNGLETRENAECPNCGSLERTRLLLFYLQNETNLFTRESTLLHIAPEDSLKKIFKKSKNINYINGDLNPNYADEIIDITDIKYPDNYFDFIICAHVLGHVPDEAKAIQEMFRVLKPDGAAFVLTLINKNDIPTYENPLLQTETERLQAYGEKDLVRLHGNDFAERLSHEGFKVETLHYTRELNQDTIQKFQLKQSVRETIFKSLKN